MGSLRLLAGLLKRLVTVKQSSMVMSMLRLLRRTTFWVRLRFWLRAMAATGLLILGTLSLTGRRRCWTVMFLLWKRLMGVPRLGVPSSWMLRNCLFLWLRRGLGVVRFTFLVITVSFRRLCRFCI